MEDSSRKILAFLFIRGMPVKKKAVEKACALSSAEFEEKLNSLKKHLENLPFLIIETKEDVELVLGKEETLFFDDYIKKEKEVDLSSGALQTLTIISYLEKPSLYEISFIRGVSAKQSVSTLLTKGLIDELENDTYDISAEALLYLGVTKKELLPRYEEMRANFLEKIEHAISS